MMTVKTVASGNKQQ